MEVEEAIIISLSEPLFRDDLLTKTNEILRKYNQKPTHKTEFNDALKKLVSDGWIIKLPKNKEGKVFYELDRNKSITGEKWFKDYQKHHEKKLLSIIQSLGKIGEEILDKHKNKIEILSRDKSKYEMIMLFALMALLEYQKYFVFLNNVGIDTPSTKSTFEKKIKNIQKTLSLILKPIANVLDKDSLLRIYGTVLRSMESEIERREHCLKVIEEAYQEKT